jgi:hypothetical protein
MLSFVPIQGAEPAGEDVRKEQIEADGDIER